MTTSPDTVLQCPTLVRAASIATSLARDGRGQKEVDAVLRTALERFIEGGWTTIDPSRVAQLTTLDESIRNDVQSVVAAILRELVTSQPTTSVLTDQRTAWRQRLEDATTQIATQVAALSLSGIPQYVGQGIAELAADLVSSAHFAGLLAERWRLTTSLETVGTPTHNVRPPASLEALTLAAYTVLLADLPSWPEHVRKARSSTRELDNAGAVKYESSILGALRRYDFRRFRNILDTSWHCTGDTLHRLNRDTPSGIEQDHFAPLVPLQHHSITNPRLYGRWWECMAIMTTMSALYRARRAPHVPPTREEALLVTLSRLPQLAEQLRNERSVSTAAGERPDRPMAEMPIPVAARAAYLHTAVSGGLPIGYVLQELYDAPDLTFGRAERQYFEQIAFASARIYAYLPSAIESSIITPDQFGALDAALDVRATAADTELIEVARELLTRAYGGGWDKVSGRKSTRLSGHRQMALEALVTRSRARQEVRLLTALRGVEDVIPLDVIASAADLPHVRRFALCRGPDTATLDSVAPTGEPMRTMEAWTRERWIQYRRSTPRDVDVLPLPIPQQEGHNTAPPFVGFYLDTRVMVLAKGSSKILSAMLYQGRARQNGDLVGHVFVGLSEQGMLIHRYAHTGRHNET